MELWIGALNLGFLYAFAAVGVFITFRIQNFPDITVDGSFTAGASTAAICLVMGLNPFIALVLAFFFGSIAGLFTGLIHSKLKVNSLLAGILVMIGFYSINLHIMGRSNIPLLEKFDLFSIINSFNPGLNKEIWYSIVLFVIVLIFWGLISYFFKSDLGLTFRGTGSNPIMSSATGINVEIIKISSVSIANGLVGLSGGLIAQYQGFADIGMGIGTVVIGLASVIIGESIIKSRSIALKILSAIIGSVVFRFMIASALYVGINPNDLKLLTAVFVLLTLFVTKYINDNKKTIKSTNSKKLFFNNKKIVYSIIAVIVISIITTVIFTNKAENIKKVKIGVIQLADNGLLNVTRESFLEEFKSLGYDETNCEMIVENANGEISNVNAILDKFLMEKVDVVVSISTPTTQAAIKKIKDIPVIFATLANPFIIKAGTNDTTHLPNVTGVYGWVPMDKVLEFAIQLVPNIKRIGAMWDPGQSNSVFNVEQLQTALKKYPNIKFEGVHISSSNEVYQAAQSLVTKDIDLFLLPPDNIVYSAFESIVKASEMRNIPIIMSDVERLESGALFTYGYDYTISGIQAAFIVDRVLHGENIAKIPFERYKRLSIGVNLKVAKKLGLIIPDSIMAKATMIVKEDGSLIDKTIKNKKKLNVALFLFNEQKTSIEVAKGVTDVFEEKFIYQKKNLAITTFSAQNEFDLAQSVSQRIITQNFDYIITLSTPALQVMANNNKKIPHIFGYVTDPYRMGVATDSMHHLPNLTGVQTFQPVESTIKLMRKMFPKAKKIGIVWNPAEACSEACTEMARTSCKKYNFELIEVNVTSTSEVQDAVRSLIAKNIDLFLTSGDNTVNMGVESIADMLKGYKIPYFTNSFSDVERGTFVSLGADYYEVGRETALYAIKVINGSRTQDLKIKRFLPEKLYLNLKLAKEYGIKIDNSIINSAAKVLR
ncbi:MAG: ABC transporter substrate binding protein [bacterium]